MISLEGLFDSVVYGAWFNPSDGTLKEIGGPLPVSEGSLAIRNTATDVLDRILILADDPSKISVPAGVYGETEDTGKVRKVFEW